MEYFRKIKGSIGAIIVGLLFSTCSKSPDITPNMLDSTAIYDPSLNAPEDYLLSYFNPNPSAEEAARPVFITCHGYTASTFEWEEFRTWTGDSADYYISMVLLGGHGLTYDEFKNATWHDWQQSIKTEYDRLVSAGYTNLNFIGSSTSCPLIVDLINSNYFTDKVVPKNIFLVDPIVIPSTKILSLVNVIGPMLGYIEADNTTEEDLYWYHFQPQETLQELNDLITKVRHQLEDGIVLPQGCSLKVYKSIQDGVADPVSAVLLFQGIKTSSGGDIEVDMIESDIHVFTRLSLRDNVTVTDQNNQLFAFNDFVLRAF
jgi:carboxylesterase